MKNKEEINKVYEKAIKKEYKIKLYPMKYEDNETVWAAEIPELPGCIGAGGTPQEALVALEDAKMSWIDIAVSDGKSIPEPMKDYDIEYSGKFTLRLPVTFHKDLSETAEEEGISLNQYLVFLISKHHYEKISYKKVEDWLLHFSQNLLMQFSKPYYENISHYLFSTLHSTKRFSRESNINMNSILKGFEEESARRAKVVN